MTKLSDFHYNLPQELIAQTPVEKRDESKLLACNFSTEEVEHKQFGEIIDYLKPGDVMVINTTKVLPVRLFGVRLNRTAKVEMLLLKRLELKKWEALIKPAKYAKIDDEVSFGELLTAKVTGILEGGIRSVILECEGAVEDVINRIGTMPLPHYIKEQLNDNSRYNTVYSKEDGSAAAPTAGLHFTPQLIEKIKLKGIEIVPVVLNVGLGTFRPVKTDDITQHKMHSETYFLSNDSAGKINAAKKEGRRIVAVGTTTVRVLESAFLNGKLHGGEGETDIFIYPPYKFKAVDALITNFHLPQSTLIMLVSAFAGRELTLSLYSKAVELKYRFFSFGDAMFLFKD